MAFDFEDIDKIRAQGFRGFFKVSQLQASGCGEVPEVPGVYLVIRTSMGRPRFLENSVGGCSKGKDPTVSVCQLEANWVDGPVVIYVGQAGGAESEATLRRRLRDFMGFGAGKPVGHYGGRYVWQLPGSKNLLICWKPTPKEDPAAVERQLIAEFKARYGKRPFANLQG